MLSMSSHLCWTHCVTTFLPKYGMKSMQQTMLILRLQLVWTRTASRNYTRSMVPTLPRRLSTVACMSISCVENRTTGRLPLRNFSRWMLRQRFLFLIQVQLLMVRNISRLSLRIRSVVRTPMSRQWSTVMVVTHL